MAGGSETREDRIERLAKRTVYHAEGNVDAETGAPGVWVPFHVISDLAESVDVELPDALAEAQQRHRERRDAVARFGVPDRHVAPPEDSPGKYMPEG